MRKLKIILMSVLSLSLTGCSMFSSKLNDMKGKLTGNSYTAYFYSNSGENFMTVEGEKISLESNVVEEPTYTSDGGWEYTQTMSSVVTINIDGEEMESCGSTILFEQKGLSQEVNYQDIESIKSSSSGISDNTLISNIVNQYKNKFGKSRIIVVQSQLGDPICAYSGDKVYYEVAEDLPKTTKVMIDGKALYIHRANFQIIDKALL